MTPALQEALRDYLIGLRTRLQISPPRGKSAEQLIAHYVRLNDKAIVGIDHAIEQLKQ